MAVDMQQLLRSASQQPWGPGRELDAKICELHHRLLEVEGRLGTEEEQPEDLETARTVGHDLRNKLMIFLYKRGQHVLSAKVA